MLGGRERERGAETGTERGDRQRETETETTFCLNQPLSAPRNPNERAEQNKLGKSHDILILTQD